MIKNTARKKRIFSGHLCFEKMIFVGAVFFCLLVTACNRNKYSEFVSQTDEYLKSINFQGSVLVASRKKVIFEEGYGLTDKRKKTSEKNTPETVFEAGSLTKQLTAAAIMQLEEKHKLSLNDNLSKFFPDYKHGNSITIKMLLNMHSGITDHINSGDEFFPKNIYHRIEFNQIQNKPVDSDIVMTYFYTAPLMAKPDSTYFYCNTNYYLLAKIIEQVSGQSYKDYICKNILEPLKMNSSNLEFQKTNAKAYDFKGRYYSIPEALSLGCGDLNSTVQDLFKWNWSFHNGKVVKRKSYKKMTGGEGYGFGVYCGPESYFHSGTTNVFNSYMAYYPKKKISVIVLENCPISEQNATFVAGNIYKIYRESENL